MSQYQTITVHGQQHVVKSSNRDRANYTFSGGEMKAIPPANYLGTGMCLCGVLQPGESLLDFINKKTGLAG